MILLLLIVEVVMGYYIGEKYLRKSVDVSYTESANREIFLSFNLDQTEYTSVVRPDREQRFGVNTYTSCTSVYTKKHSYTRRSVPIDPKDTVQTLQGWFIREKATGMLSGVIIDEDKIIQIKPKYMGEGKEASKELVAFLADENYSEYTCDIFPEDKLKEKMDIDAILEESYLDRAKRYFEERKEQREEPQQSIGEWIKDTVKKLLFGGVPVLSVRRMQHGYRAPPAEKSSIRRSVWSYKNNRGGDVSQINEERERQAVEYKVGKAECKKCNFSNISREREIQINKRPVDEAVGEVGDEVDEVDDVDEIDETDHGETVEVDEADDIDEVDGDTEDDGIDGAETNGSRADIDDSADIDRKACRRASRKSYVYRSMANGNGYRSERPKAKRMGNSGMFRAIFMMLPKLNNPYKIKDAQESAAEDEIAIVTEKLNIRKDKIRNPLEYEEISSAEILESYVEIKKGGVERFFNRLEGIAEIKDAENVQVIAKQPPSIAKIVVQTPSAPQIEPPSEIAEKEEKTAGAPNSAPGNASSTPAEGGKTGAKDQTETKTPNREKKRSAGLVNVQKKEKQPSDKTKKTTNAKVQKKTPVNGKNKPKQKQIMYFNPKYYTEIAKVEHGIMKETAPDAKHYGFPIEKKAIPVAVAIDRSFIVKHGSVKQALLFVLETVNIASRVYEKSFNVLLYVYEVIIDKEAKWYTSKGDIFSKLEEFTKYRRNRNKKCMVYHLFSGADVYQKIGLAWTNNFGYDSKLNVSVSLLIQNQFITFGHEIAHNIGLKHDCDEESCKEATSVSYPCHPCKGCSCNGKYMMSRKGAPSMLPVFSPSSQREMSVILSYFEPDMPKVEDVTIPYRVCGNGIVERGEECDAGPFGDKCCTRECRLTPGSKCSDVNDPCCIGCQVAPKGTLCRQAGDECQKNSFCDGVSPKCPSAEFLPNKAKCSAGACASGICTSKDRQCVLGGDRNAVVASLSSHKGCGMRCVNMNGDKVALVEKYFRDGTPCGIGGTCLRGECKKDLRVPAVTTMAFLMTCSFVVVLLLG